MRTASHRVRAINTVAVHPTITATIRVVVIVKPAGVSSIRQKTAAAVLAITRAATITRKIKWPLLIRQCCRVAVA
jgi:hypothetical protein